MAINGCPMDIHAIRGGDRLRNREPRRSVDAVIVDHFL
jgi:hypothetical protein